MPSVYTHFLIAQKTLFSMPSAIQNKINPHLALYYFGAQGADFCFFYKFLRPKKGNFGSYLHRTGGYDTFSVLRRQAKNFPALYAYAAGYITHYAADSILHPYVYAAAGKSSFIHSRIEGGLDCLYGKRYAKTTRKDHEKYLRPTLTKEEKAQLFSLYAAIAEKCGFPPLAKPAFLRAITIFNAYLPLSFTFLNANSPQLLKATFGADYPHRADELLLSICTRARALTEEFTFAMHADASLSHAQFGNSFLTGKSVK